MQLVLLVLELPFAIFWRVHTKSSNKEKKMTLRTLLRVAGSTGVVIPAAEAKLPKKTNGKFLSCFAEQVVEEAVRPREIQTLFRFRDRRFGRARS